MNTSEEYRIFTVITVKSSGPFYSVYVVYADIYDIGSRNIDVTAFRKPRCGELLSEPEYCVVEAAVFIFDIASAIQGIDECCFGDSSILCV